MIGRVKCSIFFVALIVNYGCYSYEVAMTVKTASDSHDPTIRSEDASSLRAIDEVAGRFGFRRSRNLEEVQRVVEMNAAFTHHVIAQYVRERHEDTNWARVLLSVGIQKDTGELSILLHDYDHGDESPFISDLQRALDQSMRSQFPSRLIEIHRKRIGPNLFGP